MKRLLPLIVGVVSGLAVLIGMFLIPQGGILSVLLNWVIVVASVALLVVVRHIAKQQLLQKKALLSLHLQPIRRLTT